MFRIMLELDGHQVLEAGEGCAGLQLLRTESPDVAFIDVGLPGLDGYEIARRFRCESEETSADGVGPSPGAAGVRARHRVLLVALTGYGTPDALERSRRAGFDHHLIKPVNPEALYKLLNADEQVRSLTTSGDARAAASRSGQPAIAVPSAAASDASLQ
jgi:CheY-like chemotaxis protein